MCVSSDENLVRRHENLMYNYHDVGRQKSTYHHDDSASQAGANQKPRTRVLLIKGQVHQRCTR